MAATRKPHVLVLDCGSITNPDCEAGMDAVAALRSCLEDYVPPIALHILRHQMKLAADESTEASFVPAKIRSLLEEAEGGS